MAGFVSARRLGRIEGQAGSWASTEAGWQETGLALQDDCLEEPASVEVSIRFVDARNVAELIWKRWRIKLSLASVGRLLAQLGISCQKPLHRAVERDEALTKKWLRSEYPRIKALAQRKHAPIFFADAAHVRSDHHAGRTWGKVGETPIEERASALV